MDVPLALDETEVGAAFGRELRGGVTSDGEPAAHLRTVRCERGNDRYPARRHRALTEIDVAFPFRWFRQEVEDARSCQRRTDPDPRRP
jgi:hypothetical protein